MRPGGVAGARAMLTFTSPHQALDLFWKYLQDGEGLVRVALSGDCFQLWDERVLEVVLVLPSGIDRAI